MREVYIIAGGTSIRNYNLRWFRDKDTICVNKSFLYVPNANYIVSMDYTFHSKLKGRQTQYFKHSEAAKIFVVNLEHPNIEDDKGKIIDNRNNIVYDLKDYDIIVKSRLQYGIGTTWKRFRCGNNSGYTGLQLAVILGYDEINLLGIDLTIDKRQSHFHGGYGETTSRFAGRLDKYYSNFKDGIEKLKKLKPEVKIYSCSDISRLNEIIPYKEIK